MEKNGPTCKVDAPCPMALFRLQKNGKDFYCTGCKKEVIDFRDRPDKDIRKAAQEGTCGIFHAKQLKSTSNYSGLQSMLFYALLFVSVLGFQVKPLHAQQATAPDSLHVHGKCKIEPVNKEDEKKEEVSTVKKRKSFFRKKKRNFISVGCPSF
jgi:hypothetical protein